MTGSSNEDEDAEPCPGLSLVPRRLANPTERARFAVYRVVKWHDGMDARDFFVSVEGAP